MSESTQNRPPANARIARRAQELHEQRSAEAFLEELRRSGGRMHMTTWHAKDRRRHHVV